MRNSIKTVFIVGSLGMMLALLMRAVPAPIAPSDIITKSAGIDSSAYSTLVAADAAAVTAGKQLYISQNYTLASNTTIRSAVTVLKGGGFTKAKVSTCTLTINGPFSAGLELPPFVVPLAIRGFDRSLTTLAA